MTTKNTAPLLTETDINLVAKLHHVTRSEAARQLKEDGFIIMEATA